MYIGINKDILDLLYSLQSYLDVDCNNCHLMGCNGCSVPKEKEKCNNIICHLECEVKNESK